MGLLRTLLTGLAMIFLGTTTGRAFEAGDTVSGTLQVFAILLVIFAFVIAEVEQ